MKELGLRYSEKVMGRISKPEYVQITQAGGGSSIDAGHKTQDHWLGWLLFTAAGSPTQIQSQSLQLLCFLING